MRRGHLRWLIFVAVPLALVGSIAIYCTWPGGGVPSETWDVLDQADEWEVYSLFPDQEEKGLSDRFCGWPVLGKATVCDPETRKRLRRALATGTARYQMLNGSNCFWPRHGIRATHGGRTVDLAICFQCGHIYQSDGKQIGTSGDTQPVFNAVLKDAGLRLAPSGYPPWKLSEAE
jgi:hypothetical protein